MIEVFKQMVEALENSVDLVIEDAYNAEQLYANVPARQARVGGLKLLADEHQKAIQTGRQAIAELESQEPVAWRYALDASVEGPRWIYIDKDPHQWLLGPAMAMAVIEKLYTHPPQRTWVGLTRMELIKSEVMRVGMTCEVCQAIEAKLKEKNT